MESCMLQKLIRVFCEHLYDEADGVWQFLCKFLLIGCATPAVVENSTFMYELVRNVNLLWLSAQVSQATALDGWERKKIQIIFAQAAPSERKANLSCLCSAFSRTREKVISCIRAGDVSASLANEASAMKNFYHSGSCLFLCPREMRNLRLFYGWKIFTDAFIHACEWSRFFIIVEEQQYTPAVVRWWKAGGLGGAKRLIFDDFLTWLGRALFIMNISLYGWMHFIPMALFDVKIFCLGWWKRNVEWRVSMSSSIRRCDKARCAQKSLSS